MSDGSLYRSRLFVLGFIYNFIMALNFTNNAIYPLYVSHEGGGPGSIGAFMAALSLSAVLGRPFVGILIDRWGVKLVLLLGSASLALPSLGYYALLGQGLLVPVWVLRLVQGFGFGAHFTAFFTLAAQNAPEGRRNEAVAMYGFSGLLANLIGPFLGEQVVKYWGLGSFFLLMSGLGVAAFLLALLLPIARSERSPLSGFGGFAAALKVRELRLVFLLAALLAVSFSASPSFLAPVSGARGIGNFGLFFTAFALAGMTIRLTGRRWGDRYGLRRILIPAFLVYSAGLITLALSASLAGIVAGGLLCGTAHGIAFPAVTSLGYCLSPRGAAGSGMALLTGMMDAGSFLASLVLGQFAALLGLGVIFPFASVAGLAAAALLAANILRKPEVIITPPTAG